MIEIRMLLPTEGKLLSDLEDDVFDGVIEVAWRDEFFADPRHHLAAAFDGPRIIGMASGVHYLHPDKPPEMFINEAGVAGAYQNQGIGRKLLKTLLAHAATLGCESAWVLTETDNAAARKMYAAAGGIEAPDRPVLIEFRP